MVVPFTSGTIYTYDLTFTSYQTGNFKFLLLFFDSDKNVDKHYLNLGKILFFCIQIPFIDVRMISETYSVNDFLQIWLKLLHFATFTFN